ncbi:MAG: hypothetical protein ACUVRD_00810 [Bacteroidia bacterium]
MLQTVAYYPFFYALALVGLGYLYARRVDKNFVFWMFVAVAELNRISATVFLVQNLGKTLALHTFRFEGLYGLLLLGIAMSLVGIILYAQRKQFFPGMWLAGLSVLQILAALTLLLYYTR